MTSSPESSASQKANSSLQLSSSSTEVASPIPQSEKHDENPALHNQFSGAVLASNSLAVDESVSELTKTPPRTTRGAISSSDIARLVALQMRFGAKKRSKTMATPFSSVKSPEIPFARTQTKPITPQKAPPQASPPLHRSATSYSSLQDSRSAFASVDRHGASIVGRNPLAMLGISESNANIRHEELSKQQNLISSRTNPILLEARKNRSSIEIFSKVSNLGGKIFSKNTFARFIEKAVDNQEEEEEDILHRDDPQRGEPEIDFHRFHISSTVVPPPVEDIETCRHLKQALALRNIFVPPKKIYSTYSQQARNEPGFDPWVAPRVIDPNRKYYFSYSEKTSLFVVDYESNNSKTSLGIVEAKNIETWYNAFIWLHEFVFNPSANSFCRQRLRLLDLKFQAHQLLNRKMEIWSQKSILSRDFYNVCRVDNHIHLAAAMTESELVEFIKLKLELEPDCIVEERIVDGETQHITLLQLFSELGINPTQLNVDTLDCHADATTFQRFDNFNSKYNPMGMSSLRSLFLKYDNYIHGRYLAELIHTLFKKFAIAKTTTNLEWRVSVYGRKMPEWDTLAKWIVRYKLFSPHVRWMVQVPRLYWIHKKTGAIETFADMMKNLFVPLFEVTQNPESHPELHLFLQQVVGFDSVDDESRPEFSSPSYENASQWNRPQNPPYSYYSYYMWAYTVQINKFRRKRGLNTFSFRPHSGESGAVDHLVSSFISADSINHGINLEKNSVIQYLYYLAQVGISVSPLSNNSLFLAYQKNPFPLFFTRGLNVTLSTDDPLQFHFSGDALLEEYTIAQQVWKFSKTDLCEIAKNSVLQSGFFHHWKMYWLGSHYEMGGCFGNNPSKTNIPNIRMVYRDECWKDEFDFICDHAHHSRAESKKIQPGAIPKRSGNRIVLNSEPSTPPGDDEENVPPLDIPPKTPSQIESSAIEMSPRTRMLALQSTKN